MKKYLIASVALSTSLFAADNAKIVDFFKSQVPPNVKVEVAKAEKVKEFPKFELVTIKMSNGSKSQNVRMFYHDGLLLPEMINLKTKKPMLQDIEKKESMKTLKSIYSKEDKNNIISLGNDPKKETMLVFTDPECPFCRKELGNVENRLKTNNVKLILTTVHGKSALQKCHLIYRDIKNAKTDAEKIKILRKYYANNVDISKEKVSDKDMQRMLQLKLKYMNSGAIQGVPAIFKEKDIK